MRQTEYLKGVLAFYRENDIVQGDPNEGRWEEAHTPLPRGIGSTTVLLLHEHHVIHDILQSEELGSQYFFYPNVVKVLYGPDWYENWFDLCDIAEYWFKAHQSKGGKKGGKGSSGQIAVERKLGVHADDFDHESAGRKGGITASRQVWKSTMDGYESTAAGVANHNRFNGWSTNAKVYIGQKPS